MSASRIQIAGDIRFTTRGFTARLKDGRLLVVDAGARMSEWAVGLQDEVLEKHEAGSDRLECVSDRLRLLIRALGGLKRGANVLANCVHHRSRVLVERDAEPAVSGNMLRRVRRVIDLVRHRDVSVSSAGAGAGTPVVPTIPGAVTLADPTSTISEATDTVSGVGDTGEAAESSTPASPGGNKVTA